MGLKMEKDIHTARLQEIVKDNACERQHLHHTGLLSWRTQGHVNVRVEGRHGGPVYALRAGSERTSQCMIYSEFRWGGGGGWAMIQGMLTPKVHFIG